MSDAGSKLSFDILDRPAVYSGEGISVKSLEEGIATERQTQDTKVDELKVLRERNVEIQKALASEVSKLRKFSDYLDGTAKEAGVWASVKELLSYIPGLRGMSLSQRSIEDLLKQQYQISLKRVKEAAEYADTLGHSEQQLYKEIARINDKILEFARNEQAALDYVLELKQLDDAIVSELQSVEAGSIAARDLDAKRDAVRAKLAEHSGNLQLYGAAEDRYATLKENTRRLVDTIRNLLQDIRQYTQAASIKLDMASGQIQAIGTAADASVVMLELKKSLDVLTESMNETTRFVSDTQVFFRRNLDNLVHELETFDETTTKVLEDNLAESQRLEDARVQAAIARAMQRRDELAQGGGQPPAAEPPSAS
jgi:predicted ribosome quality control (RQC) complex YloA/Tae2 family protein